MAAAQKSFNDCAHLVLLASFEAPKITGSDQVRNRSTTGPYQARLKRERLSQVLPAKTR